MSKWSQKYLRRITFFWGGASMFLLDLSDSGVHVWIKHKNSTSEGGEGVMVVLLHVNSHTHMSEVNF